jgi:hypothetical protein
VDHCPADTLVFAVGAYRLWLDKALLETKHPYTTDALAGKPRMCHSPRRCGRGWVYLLHSATLPTDSVASVILRPLRLGYLVIARGRSRRISTLAYRSKMAIWHLVVFVGMPACIVAIGRFDYLKVLRLR